MCLCVGGEVGVGVGVDSDGEGGEGLAIDRKPASKHTHNSTSLMSRSTCFKQQCD